jgi:hypothetical protein
MQRLLPASDMDPAKKQLWRLVDGAIMDCVKAHPDYFNPKLVKTARRSLTKRVTGQVHGFATQAAKGRSSREAACGPASVGVALARSPGGPTSPPEAGGGYASPAPLSLWRRLRALFRRAP